MVPGEPPAMPPASHPTGFHGEFGNGSQSVHRGDFHAPDGTLGAAIEKLIERLLCITVEEAGAERGVLLLMRGDSLRIAAEAATTGDAFAVRVHDARIEPALLPESVVQYVARTQESVLLDDAGAQGSFRDDEYIARGCARSILCLPLLKQPRLVAVLYLENKLGAGIFANARTGVLEGLASAAAISLENSRLDRDLQERETRLRIAENAARQSEKELRDVVGSMPAMVWSALADGRCVFVNRRWRDFTGLSPEDALGWNWQKAVHPDDLAGFRVEWVTALNTGQAMETEVRIRRTDGEYHWFFVRGVPSLDEAGNVLKWYGTSIDIEDRKRAEQKLRESEFYLAESQRLSKTGSWAANSAGIRHWSEENFRIWGFDPQGGLPSHEERFRRVHPEDRPIFAAHIEKMKGEKKDSETEYRVIHPDGRVRNIHTRAHVVLGPPGYFVEAIGTTIDVTDRKQADEALRRSEKELRDLFENMPAIACVMLPDGTHPYLTRQWADYTGLSVQQTDREGLAKVVHPEEAGSLREKVRTAMVSGEVFEHEVRLRRAADGEYRWFLVRATPLLDDTGTPVKLYGMMIDIEDRMRAKEAVRRSETYLAQAQKLTKTGSWAYKPGSVRPSYFSDEMFRLFGLSPEDKPPDRDIVEDRIVPEDSAEWRGLTEQLGNGSRKAPAEMDYRWVAPDGSVRHFHTIVSPVLDQAGEVVEYIGTSMDITERKLAEQALRRSEASRAEERARFAREIHDTLAQGFTGILMQLGAASQIPGDSRRDISAQ